MRGKCWLQRCKNYGSIVQTRSTGRIILQILDCFWRYTWCSISFFLWPLRPRAYWLANKCMLVMPAVKWGVFYFLSWNCVLLYFNFSYLTSTNFVMFCISGLFPLSWWNGRWSTKMLQCMLPLHVRLIPTVPLLSCHCRWKCRESVRWKDQSAIALVLHLFDSRVRSQRIRRERHR